MKKLITICAAALAFAVIAADTDCGVLITTGNIADSAKVENLTGANAGKATITINNNSGTAQSVTVYNSSTMDTALAGKASTDDLAAAEANAQAAANAAYANATNNAEQTYVKKSGDWMTGSLSVESGLAIRGIEGDADPALHFTNLGHSDYGSMTIRYVGAPGNHPYTIHVPAQNGTFALDSDITASTNALWTAIPSWARAATKPSYNFSEIGTKPTTLVGYGITDAKIANGTITLGSNSITPLTSYTETDPVWTSDKGSYSTTAQMNTSITAATNGLAKASALTGYVPTSRKVAGMALSSDITLKNLSIVGSSTTTYNGSATASVNQTTQTQTSTTQSGTTGKNLTIQVAATSLDMGAYYIKIGSDGKPHLMLRQ